MHHDEPDVSIDVALAQSIVMREHGCASGDAAAHIRRRALESGQDVELVAREIVRNGTIGSARERAEALVAARQQLSPLDALLVVEQAILKLMQDHGHPPEEAAAGLVRASEAGRWHDVVAVAAATVATRTDARNADDSNPFEEITATGPVEIGRAITVVMGAEDCGVDDASRLIRDTATDAHLPLEELATMIVGGDEFTRTYPRPAPTVPGQSNVVEQAVKQLQRLSGCDAQTSMKSLARSAAKHHTSIREAATAVLRANPPLSE